MAPMLDSTTAAEYLAANLERLVDPDALPELAGRAGISLAHLRSIVGGALLPCPREIALLARALDTTPAALYREPAL